MVYYKISIAVSWLELVDDMMNGFVPAIVIHSSIMSFALCDNSRKKVDSSPKLTVFLCQSCLLKVASAMRVDEK